VESVRRVFNPIPSHAWAYLQGRFGPLNQNELRSLAEVLSPMINVKLSREAKRKTFIVLQWFDDNFEALERIWKGLKLRIPMET
jgi:translation initiation factor 1 (eIF-1/SUI1)